VTATVKYCCPRHVCIKFRMASCIKF